jgi:hypothetical protein
MQSTCCVSLARPRSSRESCPGGQDSDQTQCVHRSRQQADRTPSASDGWGGRSRRAGVTASARPAAIATRRRRPRHTNEPHGEHPPPAPAGEGGRVAKAAQRVLLPPRSRRAAGGTQEPHGAAGRALRQRRLGRAAASRGRRSACSSRRDRDAPPAANTWAARGASSACAGWGGRSHRAGGTARARPAAIATRRLRHTHGPFGALPPPATA